MEIEFHIKNIVITSKQKALIEKKIAKVKKYLAKEEPITVDVYLMDETSPEKGGVDQTVHISAVIGKEKVYVEETDDRLMRAFAYAYDSFERKLSRLHHKKIDRQESGDKTFKMSELLGIFKRKK